LQSIDSNSEILIHSGERNGANISVAKVQFLDAEFCVGSLPSRPFFSRVLQFSSLEN
jgi:hypothetical protein